MQPVVITSKAADQHFDKVKAEHASILEGLTNQQQKVAQYRQTKATELAQTTAMQNDLAKSKLVADTAAQKTALDFASKNAEIDVKRAALAQK